MLQTVLIGGLVYAVGSRVRRQLLPSPEYDAIFLGGFHVELAPHRPG
jgi:hypothetical protein